MRILLLCVLVMISFPAQGLIAEKRPVEVFQESWTIDFTVDEATIGAEFFDICRKTASVSIRLGNGCNQGVPITITYFAVVVKRFLNATTEAGDVFILVESVQQASSVIAIGDGVTPVCDELFPVGDSDISNPGDSCGMNVSIDIDAGEAWQIGFSSITVQQILGYHIEGVYR